MDPLSDVSSWQQAFLQAANEIGARLVSYLPNLVGAFLILVIGWLVARAVELAAARGLRRLGLDQLAVRLRIAEVIDRAGLGITASQGVARLLFWLLMLTVLLACVDTLGLDAVSSTVDRLIAYIPNLVAAVLIVVFGLWLARFLGGVVGSGAAAAGFPNSARLGFLVQLLAAGLVVMMAIEQLGVGTALLVGPLTAVLAAAGLSAGLAFALGAHPIITHILAGHFLKRSLPRDTFVEIDGERGVVERIGAIDTVLRNGDRTWSVPNAKLINQTVIR